MNKTVQNEINDQINAEFESAYLYLDISAYFDSMNLKGFAHWMKLQWEEETAHAMKFFDFVQRRGGDVSLSTINKHDFKKGSALEVFEQVLKHEQYITNRIHKLYALAVKEGDYPLQTLLNWFVDEQVEEEENARDIIDQLRLIGDSGQALYLLDREMAARSPEEEEN